MEVELQESNMKNVGSVPLALFINLTERANLGKQFQHKFTQQSLSKVAKKIK